MLVISLSIIALYLSKQLYSNLDNARISALRVTLFARPVATKELSPQNADPRPDTDYWQNGYSLERQRVRGQPTKGHMNYAK